MALLQGVEAGFLGLGWNFPTQYCYFKKKKKNTKYCDPACYDALNLYFFGGLDWSFLTQYCSFTKKNQKQWLHEATKCWSSTF